LESLADILALRVLQITRLNVIAESSSKTFAVDVLTSKGKVAVDFWAEWCGPCRMVAPILEALAEDFPEQITIYKVNADENSGLTAELKISSIPTIIVFEDGKETKRITGAKPRGILMDEFGLI
jgi:thioredoxin 1